MSGEWRKRESMILLIGLLAQDQEKSMNKIVDKVSMLLVECWKNESEVLVICSAIWSLSRLLPILLEISSNQIIIQSYLQCIMSQINSSNTQLQTSANSAFCILLSFSNSLQISTFIPDITVILSSSLTSSPLHSNSIANLYTSIASLFDTYTIPNPQTIIHSLLTHLNTIQTLNPNINPLLECLVSVASSQSVQFSIQYGQSIFNKILLLQQEYINNKEEKLEYQLRQVLLRTIDLLSVLVDQLGQQMIKLQEMEQLLSIITQLINNNNMEVLQFVISLIGEIAAKVSNNEQIKIILNQLLPNLINKLYYPGQELDAGNTYMGLCNNTLYCLGEISVTYPEVLLPYLHEIQSILMSLLVNNPKLQKVFAQTLSKTLGRLTLLDGTIIAQNLSSFIKQWCLSIKSCSDSLSKQQSCIGMFNVFLLNLPVAIQFYPYILYVFASLDQNFTLFSQIQYIVTQISIQYKSTQGEQQLINVYNGFDTSIQQKLKMFI